MPKYQVKYKVVKTDTNEVVMESVLYSTIQPTKRILFNNEEEAKQYMENVKNGIKQFNGLNFEYELYDAKIKLK